MRWQLTIITSLSSTTNKITHKSFWLCRQVDGDLQLRSLIEACPGSNALLLQIEERARASIDAVFPSDRAAASGAPDRHAEVPRALVRS